MPSSLQIYHMPRFSPAEESAARYICESTARPPPKLYFLYDGTAVRTAIHQPPLHSILPDSENNTSHLTWITNASRSMNRQLLTCHADHPEVLLSGSIEEHLEMTIFCKCSQSISLSLISHYLDQSRCHPDQIIETHSDVTLCVFA